MISPSPVRLVLTAIGALVAAMLAASCTSTGSEPSVAPPDREMTDAAAQPPAEAADAGQTDSATDGGTPNTDAGQPPATTDAGQPSSLCPPEGPFGGAEGDTAPNVELFDCSGNPVSLHELCEYQASWVFQFAAWCPPCQAFARNHAADIYEEFAGEDFEAFFVISESPSFSDPDASLCASIREDYDLPMRVLFDPSQSLASSFGVAVNNGTWVFERGMRLRWEGGRDDEASIRTEIQAALAE